MQNCGYFYFTLKKTDLFIEFKLQNNDNEIPAELIEKLKKTFEKSCTLKRTKNSNLIEICHIPAEKWIAKEGNFWNLEKTIENLHAFEDKLWIEVLGNNK